MWIIAENESEMSTIESAFVSVNQTPIVRAAKDAVCAMANVVFLVFELVILSLLAVIF